MGFGQNWASETDEITLYQTSIALVIFPHYQQVSPV